MQNTGEKIAVLGAGSFGTAMAVIAAERNTVVYLLCRDPAQVEQINMKHVNIKRFTDFVLPSNIIATMDVEEAFRDVSLIVHAIPSQSTPEFVEQISHKIPNGVPYICTSKGIHVESNMLMCDAIKLALNGRGTCGENRAEIPLGFLSGPSFAKEMMKKDPISVVVASTDSWCAKRTQHLLGTSFFKIFRTDDVIGVELGGAMKNPLAIGAGIAIGLGFGQSTIAALVTRGCREMLELAVALGARQETLYGLSGVGDLMLTCYSSLSRNNRFGICLAEGMTPEAACLKIGEIVEGYSTCPQIIKLARDKHIKLPLFYTINSIISGKISPSDGFAKIMLSEISEERFV